MKPAYWEKETLYLRGRKRKRAMIVFKTLPCSKFQRGDKCFHCGFEVHSRDVKKTNVNLVEQFRYVEDQIQDISHINILSSGSILDEEQIDYNCLLKLIDLISKNSFVESVLIEGRVEYCDEEKIRSIKNILKPKRLEYGIGLEAWSGKIRNKILNKNLKIRDYLKCLKKLHRLEVGVCSYVLAGFPKISSERSLKETEKTILSVVDNYEKYGISGRIALYPLFIAPGSGLEEEYKKGVYEIIDLSKIINILKSVKSKINLKKYPIYVGLDDENISKNRLIRTKDQKEELRKVKKFNSTQQI